MNPSIFNFNEHGVRIAFDVNGQPLFCLPDVGQALDIKNATASRFKLNPKGVHEMYTLTNGGTQKLTFISEENLYRIVFRSTKPEALNFQNWVFAEVLPSIRKTGSYSARQTAYEELNRLCMQAKTQKAKGSFHGTGLVNHRYSMRDLNLRITTCKANLQLTFEGIPMIEHVDPEFFKAFDHYKAMREQYGEHHPITEQALILTMHYTPEHIKEEMHQKAKELNLLPPPSGYTDDGEPMYQLEDIAKHFGISFEEAEQRLLQMMDNRQQVGLSNDGVLINSNIHINRVQ